MATPLADIEQLESNLAWLESKFGTGMTNQMYARLICAVRAYCAVVPSSLDEMRVHHCNGKILRALFDRLFQPDLLQSIESVHIGLWSKFARHWQGVRKLPKHRIAFTGSRDYTNEGLVARVLRAMDPPTTLIVHGGCATGLDAIVDRLARYYDFRVKVVSAEWKKHGKAAGPIRNAAMLDAWEPHRLYAFYSNVAKKSHGTSGCIREAEKRGVQVVLAHKMFAD